MEYSKEDLMEAKKQILGVGENMGTEESKKIWEENAQFWDNAMGDESNEFHREVVRPKVTELLSPNPADYILDIACGNGWMKSFSATSFINLTGSRAIMNAVSIAGVKSLLKMTLPSMLLPVFGGFYDKSQSVLNRNENFVGI